MNIQVTHLFLLLSRATWCSAGVSRDNGEERAREPSSTHRRVSAPSSRIGNLVRRVLYDVRYPAPLLERGKEVERLLISATGSCVCSSAVTRSIVLDYLSFQSSHRMCVCILISMLSFFSLLFPHENVIGLVCCETSRNDCKVDKPVA